MESKNNNNSDDVIQLGLGEGSGRQESLLAFAGIGGLPQSMTHLIAKKHSGTVSVVDLFDISVLKIYILPCFDRVK